MLSRKKRKILTKRKVLIITTTFLIMGFFIGYYQTTVQKKEGQNLTDKDNLKFSEKNFKLEDESELKDNMRLEIEVDEDKAVDRQEDVIVDRTNITYKTFYKLCGDIIEETILTSQEVIGLNELGFKNYLLNENLRFEIKEFSDEKIILIKEDEVTCPKHYNHYLVMAQDDFISIFFINQEGEKILVEKTSISSATLPYVDQKKLEKGIFKNTAEEAYELLEDYM